jgi:hypothetical protein
MNWLLDALVRPILRALALGRVWVLSRVYLMTVTIFVRNRTR